MARPQYQQRTAAATEGGQIGADQARRDADKLTTPTDPIEALGYWDEIAGLSKARIGEMIDGARSQGPADSVGGDRCSTGDLPRCGEAKMELLPRLGARLMAMAQHNHRGKGAATASSPH